MRSRPEVAKRIEELIRANKVKKILPSEVKRIGERDIDLVASGAPITIPNDAVIVQIGGMPPGELLQGFGVEVVTKRGES